MFSHRRDLRSHPIHASLYKPVLFLGLEQSVAILEGMLIIALVVGIGLHIATLGLAVLIALLIHPVMAWATAQDAAITRVYVRSLFYHDYYPARGIPTLMALPVRPSIPATR